jgi:hypothetical protein
MGNELPLPERIPAPSEEQQEQLEDMGIAVVPDATPYWRFVLPHGWRIVDDSIKKNSPDFYIIDGRACKRVSIEGRWDFLDRVLTLHILDGTNVWKRSFCHDVRKYYDVLDLTSGYGQRGQSHIDTAYEKLKHAYDALPEGERGSVTIPEKRIVKNG